MTGSQQSPKGFVLLVENENIDTAGHHNDAAALMRALWAFDDAVRVALEFRRRHPETLVIITGDHETGGFSPTYALKDLSSMSRSNRFYNGDAHLRMLDRITMSFDAVKETLSKRPSGEVLDQILVKHFPGFRLDPDLREQILGGKPDERNFSYLPHNSLGRMVARRPATTGARQATLPSPWWSAPWGPERSCSVDTRTAPSSASTCTVSSGASSARGQPANRPAMRVAFEALSRGGARR